MKYFTNEHTILEKTEATKGKLGLDLGQKTCRLLMHDICRISELRRPHELELGAGIMPHRYTRERYGRERRAGKMRDTFAIINEQYPIFEFDSKYSPSAGFAMPVRITKWAQDRLATVAVIKKGTLVDVEGEPFKRSENSRQATLRDGRRTRGQWSVPSRIDCDADAFTSCMEIKENETQKEKSNRLYATGLFELHSALGYLPQSFMQHPQGRHFATGYNLQSCKREMRNQALRGRFQFDIRNCHGTIARQIAERANIITPELRAYDDDSDGYRIMLSIELGCTIQQIKKAVLILLNGGKLHGKSMRQNLGDVFETAKCNLRLKRLASELHAVGSHMLSDAKKHRGLMINSIGFGMPVSETRAKRLAHLYQSIEAQANMACLAVHKSALLPIHDGYICAHQEDKEFAEVAMLSATGFEFQLTVKQL